MIKNKQLDNPLISVIVPCYNQAEYLSECLQSVEDQTYSHWECIIVDDGSPDDTERIALKWTSKDVRFKYLRKENGGLSSARNSGLQLAKGDWIQFLDCDDLIVENKFEASSKFFGDHDLILSDFVYFRNMEIMENKRPFIERQLNFRDVLLHWDVDYIIPIHCALIRRSQCNSFKTELKAKEDWFFWLEFFKKTDSYVCIDSQLALYRQHEGSMTTDIAHMFRNETVAYQYIYQIIPPELRVTFLEHRIRRKNFQILSLSKNVETLKMKIHAYREKKAMR